MTKKQTKEDLMKLIENKHGIGVTSLYKAEPPFMPYKNGYGYLGVVLWDINEDRVQCHFCGKWFKHLAPHIRNGHKIMPVDYKTTVGLYKNTPLQSQQLNEERKKFAVKQYKNNFRFQQEAKKQYKIKRKSYNGGNDRKKYISIQEKNFWGTCDMQLKYRFDEIVKTLGRTPAYDECSFATVLIRRFGTYLRGVKALGHKPVGKSNKMIDKKSLLEELLKFKEIYGREPRSSDFRERHLLKYSDAPYIRLFGGLTKARKLVFG